MKLLVTGFRYAGVFLLLSSAAFSEFAIHGSNDVSIDPDGWIRAIEGDPYIVYKSDSVDPDSFPILEIEVEGRNVHIYTELFWATEQRGFSEEYKGFYVMPFSPDKKPMALRLNFRDFARALGDNSKRIDLVRLDLLPTLKNTDFECRIKMRWLSLDESTGMTINPIHPPYLSRYLLKPGIIQYSVSNLTRDIFQRITRDWFFLVLYLGSISFLLFLIWRWRKAPNY
jgi:hypothetical protein